MALPFLITIHNRRAPIVQPWPPERPEDEPEIVGPLRNPLPTTALIDLVDRALQDSFAGSAASVELLRPSVRPLSPAPSTAPRFAEVVALIRPAAASDEDQDVSAAIEALVSLAEAVWPGYASEFAPLERAPVADGRLGQLLRVRNALVALRQAGPIRALERMDVAYGFQPTVDGYGIELNFQLVTRTHRPVRAVDPLRLGSLAPGVRVPTLAVFDMDSTLIDQEVIDEIAELMDKQAEQEGREGTYGRAVAEITERAMRGELDFEASLRERVRLLRGLAAADLFDQVRPRISFRVGIRQLIQALQQSDLVRGSVEPVESRCERTVLDRLADPDSDSVASNPNEHIPVTQTAVISGGFLPLARWIARPEELDLDHAHANELGFAGHPDAPVLSGELVGEIVGPEYKRHKTAELEAGLRDSSSDNESLGPPSRPDRFDEPDGAWFTLAVGDGANDMLMLRAVDAGVGYRAKPAVQRVAPTRLNLPIELELDEVLKVSRDIHLDELDEKLREERAAEMLGPLAGAVDVLALLGWDYGMIERSLD